MKSAHPDTSPSSAEPRPQDLNQHVEGDIHTPLYGQQEGEATETAPPADATEAQAAATRDEPVQAQLARALTERDAALAECNTLRLEVARLRDQLR